MIRIVDDGSSSLTAADSVLSRTLEISSPHSEGTFDITALYDQGRGQLCYVLASAGDTTPHIWISDSLNGNSWKTIGRSDASGDTYIHSKTSSQGGGEGVVDMSVTSEIINGDAVVRHPAATDHHYGGVPPQPVDKRLAYGNIEMPFGGLVFDKFVDDANVTAPITYIPDGRNDYTEWLRFGQKIHRNASTGSDIFTIDWFNGLPDHQSPSQNVVWNSETTVNRPPAPNPGQRLFDTDLGQPIWYDGNGWVDATGTSI